MAVAQSGYSRVTGKKNIKTEQSGSSKESLAKKSFDFAGDVKSEFRKITWTEKEELQVYTKVVLASTICCGLLVFLADFVIKSTLDAINLVLKVFGA